MCTCFPIFKVIRESSGSDAINLYDPGSGGRAFHAIGPAASLASCVGMNGVVNTVGAVFDKSGFITATFTAPGVFMGLSPSFINFAAWNGTSRAWFWNNSFNASGGIVFAFNLSGTLLLTQTSAGISPRNRFGFACNSSGNLVAIIGTNIEIRNDSWGSVASASTPNTAFSYFYGDTCCVDSSDNVFVTTETYIRKYNSSLSTQWTVSLPLFHLACVADSSGAVIVASNDSGVGKLRKYNSSGSLQWTVSLSGAFDKDYFDIWCDGSNTYLSGKITGSPNLWKRYKYDSSGSLVWSDDLWWGVDWNGSFGLNQPLTPTIRGDGSLIALAAQSVVTIR